MCAMLPPGLQVLHLDKGLITTKGSSKLPKSLTYLFACLNVFDNNESLSYLRHISEIYLSRRETAVGDLNSNWLSSLLPSSSPTFNRDWVSGRTDICDNNYHLTSLHLCGADLIWDESSSTPHVQKPLFDTLHKFKNLTTLQIEYCQGISNNWLCLIPRTVTFLKLYLRTFPSAKQLSMLPPCLHHFGLHVGDPDSECGWTDEILQALPRSLHTFWISVREFPNLTKRMYEYLPLNLQHSSMKYNCVDSNIDFIPPLDRLYGSSTN